MATQNHIGVRMSGKLHLQLFFHCCKCGESICSTGIANDYYYPQWFLENPILPANEGYLCYACAIGADQRE